MSLLGPQTVCDMGSDVCRASLPGLTEQIAGTPASWVPDAGFYMAGSRRPSSPSGGRAGHGLQRRDEAAVAGPCVPVPSAGKALPGRLLRAAAGLGLTRCLFI